MASRLLRPRVILIVVAVAALIAALVWWRTRDAAAPRAEAADGAEVARDEARAARGGPRRPIDDDGFGAQFQGGAPVQIDGQVIDETGAGIAGVDVTFAARGADEAVTSGRDGGFTIALKPGAYEVRAIGERLYGAPKPLRVGKITEPLRLVVEVAHLASLHGWVVDAAGAPVRGATVVARAPKVIQAALDRDGAGGSTTTGADGKFELDGFPGAIQVVADHPTAGHGRTALTGVPAGSLEEDLEIKLAPYAVLAGVVVAPDGRPLAGVDVTATIRAAETRQSVTATSGGGGRFVLEGLTPGRVVLDAVSPGEPFAPADPQAIVLAASERREDLVVTLNVIRTLGGRVVDGDGEPVFNAKVKAQRQRSDVTFKAARTNIDGAFEITGLDGGPHDVTVDVGGVVQLTLKLDSLPEEPLELVLAAPTTLRGVVTDAAGKPVREFTVTIEHFVPAGRTRKSTPPLPAQHASDDGRYEQPLDPGTYDLLVTATGHGPARKPGLVVESGVATDGSVQLGPP